MSTGRWRVTGLHGAHEFLDWKTGETRTEICTRWGVTSPEGYDHEFFTHAEALAYADRQARTVEVELPEAKTVAEISGEAPPTLVKVISWKTVTFIQEGHNEVGIFTPDLKPLALHLLALHYHHERN